MTLNLEQFTGTLGYYAHWIDNYKYTDGIKYLAEEGKAFWLLDAVFSYRRKEPFQIWELFKKEEGYLLTMKEDSDQPNKVEQDVKWSDFPLDHIKLYLIDEVLLLPSEY